MFLHFWVPIVRHWNDHYYSYSLKKLEFYHFGIDCVDSLYYQWACCVTPSKCKPGSTGLPFKHSDLTRTSIECEEHLHLGMKMLESVIEVIEHIIVTLNADRDQSLQQDVLVRELQSYKWSNRRGH